MPLEDKLAATRTLVNHDGRRVSTNGLLAAGRLVLSFFRGSW